MKPRQLRAVALLSEGQSARQVAQVIGVNERTVTRWRSDPEFSRMLREAIETARRESSDRWGALSARAVDAVSDGLGSNDPGVKLNAARAYLHVEAKREARQDRVIYDRRETLREICPSIVTKDGALDDEAIRAVLADADRIIADGMAEDIGDHTHALAPTISRILAEEKAEMNRRIDARLAELATRDESVALIGAVSG